MPAFAPVKKPNATVKQYTLVDVPGGKIFNPEEVEYVPRDEFISHVIATVEATKVEAPPVEQAVLDYWKKRLTIPVETRIEISPETVRMARDYKHYLKGGARLPKFTRWAAGLFPNHPTLNNELAKLGQVKATAGSYKMAGDAASLLRAGVSSHFASCFKAYGHEAKGAGEKSLIAICSAPGIAVLYADETPTGPRGRAWVYHAKIVGTNEDVVVFARPYGHVNLQPIAEKLQAAGIKALQIQSWAFNGNGAQPVKVTFENVGPTFYNDHNLWARATAFPLV